MEESDLTINVTVFEKGSEQKVSKYDFSNAHIDGSDQGQVVIGEHQNVSHVINQVAESSRGLKEEVDNSDLSDEKKEEVKSAIDYVENEVKAEKPNKTILSGILSSIQSGIDIATKTPGLITAYEKWKTFIDPLIGS